MRSTLRILIILALCLLPLNTALAQDFDDNGSALCDPEYFLSVYAIQLFTVQDLDQLITVLGNGFTTLLDCGGEWFELLLNMFFPQAQPTPPHPAVEVFDPNDGVLTPAEAEFAIESIFTDTATTNLYFCPAEQLDPTDFEGIEDFADSLSIDATCQDDPEGMRCSVSFTTVLDGVEDNFTEETIFNVENGKLCAEAEE